MRTSTYNYNEAINEVKNFLAAAGIAWNGERYPGKYQIEETSGDCKAYPCPRELDSWSGETSVIKVLDFDSQEELFAVAFWE